MILTGILGVSYISTHIPVYPDKYDLCEAKIQDKAPALSVCLCGSKTGSLGLGFRVQKVLPIFIIILQY